MVIEYTVKKGDTLSKIAKKYYLDEKAFKELAEHPDNAIPNPNKIEIGQIVKLPDVLLRKSPAKPGAGGIALPLKIIPRVMSIEILKIESTRDGAPAVTVSNDDFTGRLGEKAKCTVAVYGGNNGETFKVSLDFGRLTNTPDDPGTPDVNESFTLIAKVEQDVTINAEPTEAVIEWDGKATKTVARQYSKRKLRNVNSGTDVDIPLSDTTAGSYVPHGLYFIDEVRALSGAAVKAKLRPANIGISVPVVVNLTFNADWTNDLRMYGISVFSDQLKEALRRFGERDYMVAHKKLSNRINVRYVVDKGIANTDGIPVVVGGTNGGGGFGNTPDGPAPLSDNIYVVNEGIGSDITINPGAFCCNNDAAFATAAEMTLFRNIFNPLGVRNTTTGGVYVNANARAVSGTGEVSGACDAVDSTNVTLTLDSDGIPSVTSNDPAKVPPKRRTAIQRGLRAFVRMVGNTLNHEVSHGLGVVSRVRPNNSITIGTTTVTAPLDGDGGAHNKTTSATNIMDDGSTRSFPRRIEDTGKQQKFNAVNARYMKACVKYDLKDN